MKVRKRKGEMITLMTVQGCCEPSLFHSGSMDSCWDSLISYNLILCFALLSLPTDIGSRNKLSLYEPVRSGVGICYSLIITRERGYPKIM